MVEKKFGPKYPLPDYLNYLVTSNHPNPLYLEPDDRRAFVATVNKERLDPKLGQRISACFRDGAEGVAALMYHFLHFDLTGFDPNEAPPMTKAKEIVIESSMTDLERYARDLAEDPDQHWRDIFNKKPNPCDLGESADVLVMCRGPEMKYSRATLTAMGNAMHKAGFPSLGLVRTKHGRKRLWAIRNWAKWRDARPNVLAAHWDQTMPDPPSKEE